MNFIIFLFLLIFLGCTTAQVTVKTPLYQYKPDIEIGIDGKAFDGMGAVPLSAKRIQIISKAKLDLLMISSCHRNFTIERVDANWFGGSKKKYLYDYIPTTIESEEFCPLYIQAFDRSGITAWGYIAFSSSEKLTGKLICNGNTSSNVVSVCASRAGFEQGLHFDKPIEKFVGSELCEITKLNEGDFRLRTKSGFCYATFYDGKDFHRLVLLGYDEALIRGE